LGKGKEVDDLAADADVPLGQDPEDPDPDGMGQGPGRFRQPGQVAPEQSAFRLGQRILSLTYIVNIRYKEGPVKQNLQDHGPL
jgi:hypothetical protein